MVNKFTKFLKFNCSKSEIFFILLLKVGKTFAFFMWTSFCQKSPCTFRLRLMLYPSYPFKSCLKNDVRDFGLWKNLFFNTSTYCTWRDVRNFVKVFRCTCSYFSLNFSEKSALLKLFWWQECFSKEVFFFKRNFIYDKSLHEAISITQFELVTEKIRACGKAANFCTWKMKIPKLNICKLRLF